MGPGEFRHVVCADQWASQASAKLPGLSGRFRGGIPASGFLGPIWYISSAMVELALLVGQERGNRGFYQPDLSQFGFYCLSGNYTYIKSYKWLQNVLNKFDQCLQIRNGWMDGCEKYWLIPAMTCPKHAAHINRLDRVLQVAHLFAMIAIFQLFTTEKLLATQHWIASPEMLNAGQDTVSKCQQFVSKLLSITFWV